MALFGYIPKWKKRLDLRDLPAADPKAKMQRYLNRPNKRSTKLQKSDRLYHAQAKEFLARPENQWCRVHFALTGQKLQATCVHHKLGRHKTLKFDQRFWIQTAYHKSLWPHQNIEKARELGLIALAGDWNKEPGDEETARLKSWMEDEGIY